MATTQGSPTRVAAALTAALVAAALAFLPAAFGGSGDDGKGLSAYIVATNRGPLPACDSNCTSTNIVWHFIHVVNTNRLTNENLGTNRATLLNSFVVSSVDWKVFVNGVYVPEFNGTVTPPPNPPFAGISGHWPSTVTCTPGTPPPCNVIGNPAIVPGENTVIVYTGWIHGSGEVNGTYVFKYTIHGTLNGNPGRPHGKFPTDQDDQLGKTLNLGERGSRPYGTRSLDGDPFGVRAS